MFAGIVWDPREPPPPGNAQVIDDGRHFRYNRHHLYGDPIVAQVDRYDAGRPFNPHPVRPQHAFEGVVIPKPERTILPPLSVSLTAHIVQDTAKVTVTQLFWNNSGDSIRKAAYTFPLPASCTATAFSCRVGRNRIVKATVKPKPEAREAFNNAVRSDQTAALLEQNTPEIFTTTLGNIPANTKLKTEITYIILLKHKFADNCNTTSLTIPTYVAPRYGTPPADLQTAQRMPHGLAIHIDVVAAEAVQKISSNTHKITVERGAGINHFDNWAEFAATDDVNNIRTASVKLEDGVAFLDKDFVLDIATLPQDGLETPTAWLETHPSLENHKAVMLTIPPKFMLRNQLGGEDGEIIFVADRSGSMSDKIDALKSAMGFFLKGIPQGRKFNIWCFGSQYTSLWEQSLVYSEDTLQEALNYVAGQFASDMGGTELLPALKAISSTMEGFHMVDLVILTDGQVWRLDETISFVKDTRKLTEGGMRFFSLGIGNSVSHALVEGIAKAGGGYAEVISTASQGGWEDRVVAMLGAALTGHIAPIRIEFDENIGEQARGRHLLHGNHNQDAAGPKRPDFLQSPADISTLSPFLRNRAFMLFDSAAAQAPFSSIDIKVTTPGGGEIITRVPIQSLEKKDSTLHKLGARALLGDLEGRQSWIHQSPSAPPRDSIEETKLIRHEGEALGCKWSLVSKWTSFFAVQEDYQAVGDSRVPFLDAEDIHIQEAAGDLDLLRPRGAAGQVTHRVAMPDPAIAAVAAEVNEDEGEDEDEDTTSGSEHRDTGNDGDSDSEGGGDDGNNGGAGANQNSGSGGDQQEPGARDNNPGEDGGEGDGISANLQGDAPVGPVPGLVAFDHVLGSDEYSLRDSEVFGSIPDITVHKVTYTGLQPQSLPPQTRPQASYYSFPLRKSSRPLLRLKKERDGSALGSASTKSRHRSDADLQDLYPAAGRRKLHLPHETIHSSFYQSFDAYCEDPLSSYDNHRSATPPVSQYTSGNQPLPQGPPSRADNSSSGLTSAANLPPPLSAPYKSSYNKSSARSYGFSSYHESERAEHSNPYGIPAPAILQMPALPSQYGPSIPAAQYMSPAAKSPSRTSTTSSYDWTFSSMINAPSNNIPASTAMLPDQSLTSKSAKEKEEEQKIHGLLALQSYDGSFRFTGLNDVEVHLGPGFTAVVRDLQLQVELSIAVAIAIVTLLEEKFQFCRDLWMLVVQKTRAYIDQKYLPTATKDGLYQSARKKILPVDIPTGQSPAALRPTGGFQSMGYLGLSAPMELSNEAEWWSAPTELSNEAEWWSAPTELSNEAELWSGTESPEFSSQPLADVAFGEDSSKRRVVLETAPEDVTRPSKKVAGFENISERRP